MTIKELHEHMNNMDPLDFCFTAGLLLGQTKSKSKMVEEIRFKVSKMLEEEACKTDREIEEALNEMRF